MKERLLKNLRFQIILMTTKYIIRIKLKRSCKINGNLYSIFFNIKTRTDKKGNFWDQSTQNIKN